MKCNPRKTVEVKWLITLSPEEILKSFFSSYSFFLSGYSFIHLELSKKHLNGWKIRKKLNTSMKHNTERKYFLSVAWWNSNQCFRTFGEAGKLRSKTDSFLCAQTREQNFYTFSFHVTISFMKSTISFIAISDNNNRLHWVKINRTEHFSGDLFSFEAWKYDTS